MSDVGILISQAVATTVTPLAPWTFSPDIVSGVGGWIEARLTAGKAGGNGWVAGYIPRDGALPEIDLAVDLEAGGDAEQLRSVTVQIADQMSDGQAMSTWLRSIGANLSGASVQIYASAPIGGYPYPNPIWTGVIRQSRITLSRLGLACESPLDSDPLGEIVSDSSIRPIIYGQALKVKLPALPIAEDVISSLVAGIAAPVEGFTDPPTRAVVADSAAAGVILTTTDPVSNLNYIILCYGLNVPDIAAWFPGNVVPDTNDWYIEIVAGKGAGTVRRLTAGSAVEITTSGLPVPYPLENVNEFASVRATEWTRSIKLQVDIPFTDPDSTDLLIQGTYKRAYSPSPGYVPIDTWEGGEDFLGLRALFQPEPNDLTPDYQALRDYYVPRADRSYARIIRKGRSFALPINSGFISASPLFVKQDSTYLQVNNAEDLFRIDADKLFVIPSADSLDKATCYFRLDPDWNYSRVLAESVNDFPANHTPLQDELLRIFSGNVGDVAYVNRFRIHPSSVSSVPWSSKNHLTIALANPKWDLSGAEAFYLCAEVRWARSDSEADVAILARMAITACRPSPLEAWWYPPYSRSQAGPFFTPDADSPYRAEIPDHTAPAELAIGFLQPASEFKISTIPPGLSTRPGPLYRWRSLANKIENTNDARSAISHFIVFLGAHREYDWDGSSGAEKFIDFELRQLMILASRVCALSEIFVDVNGPSYSTDSAGTQWSKRIGGYLGWTAVPLTDGMSTAEAISDHAHAYEDIFRRHTKTPWISNPVDGAVVEQACVDLWSKTQVGLTLLPASARPKLSVAFTESSPQVSDVCAQLCRDGMLVGSRNGRGQRTVKAWLARSLLEEQDATILESELFRDSISESPVSALSKLVSAPLIRYGQQGGAPASYIQVTRPDADEWDASYTIGFRSSVDAQRAWEICHRGWRESGVAHARELRMDTIPEYDSLMALTLPPRGTTFFDWLSRPKRRLLPQVALSHPAAALPRGSRVKISHWRYAPAGAWGTLYRATLNTQSQVAKLELMMDLDP